MSARRAPALAGIAFVVLMLANVFGSPSSGQLGDPGATVITRISAHAGAIQVWNWLLSVAVVGLLVFAAGVTSRVGQPDLGRRVAFAGATVLAATAVVQHAVTAVLTYLVVGGGIGPGAASLLNQADYVGEDLVRVGLCVFVGAASLGREVHPSCAGKVRVLGLVCAGLNLLAAGATAHSGLLQPEGPLAALGLLSFVLWTLAVSVKLLRTAPADEARPAPAVAPGAALAG